ncbi:MAG: NAD(P)-binding domain-containing protein [Bacteroidetes bacterium]|nr:NAD(P)-binding domain-containing protein [Bacteroidota bacterium]
MSTRFELGFIGAGNMAEGIARALVRSGVFPGDRLIASDPADARRAVFEKLGATTTDDNRRVATESAALILAVKPQAFPSVAAALRGAIATDAPVISIMAGVSTATIAAELGETAVGSDHYGALFTLGIFLFLITFIINVTADTVIRGIRRK